MIRRVEVQLGEYVNEAARLISVKPGEGQVAASPCFFLPHSYFYPILHTSFVKMMSKRCLKRNQTLIPELLKNHGALLYGDTSVVDLSTAENQLLMEELLPEFQAAFDASTWSSQVS